MASQLDGSAQALAQLSALTDAQAAQAVRAATRAGGKPILQEMQARVPSGREPHRTYKGRLVAPGFLSRNLRMIVTRSKSDGTISAVFGVRKEAFYGTQFVERGTEKMRAEPWLVPAIEAAAPRSIAAFSASLVKWLQKIAAKANRA